MKKEIHNFKAFTPEYWRARISGNDFESAMRYAEREGLRRGAAILFARHANPKAYNEWRAKQNPNVQRMTAHPANKQSFSMPRGFRVIGA
jgi:hypothetical protein